ncbi:MAG: endo-1,4-beta-xylanase [Thermoleophilaceae bacterium]|nr:endo-1,4-beta-xylanase [Thermoleophilaceae bacterium]
MAPTAPAQAQSREQAPTRRSGPPVLGAAVSWDLMRSSRPYRRLFLAHYRALTPENVMKMDSMAPAPDRLHFTEADGLVRWARRHDVAVHGHALVWGKQLPAWMSGRDWEPGELRSWLESYVKAVVGHFRGRVDDWDVVNEPLAANGSLRRNLWLREIGPGYVADALRWAREANPRARLYVNEFNIEGRSRKTRGMLALLKGLRGDGVPLDGLGLQTHLTTSFNPGRAELRATMRRYAALGLAVDVSEMDVAAAPGRRDALEQARIYRRVAAACRDLPACGRFTTWGFTDASTWLGTAQRPLPFSAAGEPKPAWRAIRSALRR